MHEKEYVRHVANLASGQFHTDLVPPAELDFMLLAARGVGAWADAIKRGLFYGTELARPLTGGNTPTSLQYNTELAELMHGVIGLFGEAAELMEQLHDALTGTKDLDPVHLIEEIGDVHWYLALIHKNRGITCNDAWETNIAKLRKRYPQKFTEADAQHENRDLAAERQALALEIDANVIAQECHETNRTYCKMIGDDSQVAWEDAPEWQRQSAINGVKYALEHPDVTPDKMHENWRREKLKDGWAWGPVKDPESKLHPCIVSYGDLPIEQQIKDWLFLTTVRRLSR